MGRKPGKARQAGKIAAPLILAGLSVLWPGEYQDIHQFFSENFDFSTTRSERHRLLPSDLENKVQEEGEKMALIISGSTDEGFEEQTRFAYYSFRRAGFHERNIFVLHENTSPSYVRKSPSRKNIASAFSWLNLWMDENDVLFIYATNHGYINAVKRTTGIVLANESISCQDLFEEYERIKPNYCIAIFSSCFSGNSAELFGRGNTVAISASKPGKVLALPKFFDKRFDITFFSALGGQDPDGNRVDADFNRDGRVSVDEIFEYATNTTATTNPAWAYSGILAFVKDTPQMYWQDVDPSEVYVR